jgi:hypothetical protein
MAQAAKRIRIPNLAPKFVRDRNPDGNWVVERFNENISLLDELAGNLPRSLLWRRRTVEQLKAETDRLYDLGRPLDAYRLAWQDILDQVQAFGLLSTWRLTELVSSAVWAVRRNDPLSAAIMARAALETSASYAWFQSKVRPGIDDVIGKDEFVTFEQLEDEILKTLWASRLEDADEFYNPTNIVTIIGHITKKVPYQGDVKDYYGILCDVAHPNMLGRSIFLSEEDGRTVISRKRGPSAAVIEHASLFALSWAAGTLPSSLTPMQDTCVRMMQDLDRFSEKVSPDWKLLRSGKFDEGVGTEKA